MPAEQTVEWDEVVGIFEKSTIWIGMPGRDNCERERKRV